MYAGKIIEVGKGKIFSIILSILILGVFLKSVPRMDLPKEEMLVAIPGHPLIYSNRQWCFSLSALFLRDGYLCLSLSRKDRGEKTGHSVNCWLPYPYTKA